MTYFLTPSERRQRVAARLAAFHQTIADADEDYDEGETEPDDEDFDEIKRFNEF